MMLGRRCLCGVGPKRLTVGVLALGTVYFAVNLVRFHAKTYDHTIRSSWNNQPWTPLKITDFIQLNEFRNNVTHITTTTQMTGFERAAYLRAACQRLSSSRTPGGHPSGFSRYTSDRVRVSYSRHYDALYCPMCKMASTFWTRVFKMLERNRNIQTLPSAKTPILETNRSISNGVFATGNVTLPVAKTPFDIPISQAPASKQHFDIARQLVRPDSYNAPNAFKFLFVRSPYSLLFSAYVDKLVGPNPIMWKTFGDHSSSGKARNCGHSITFKEFVEYVTRMYISKQKADCHVEKVTACSPCKANYTFVGQMETFKTDTFQILSKLGQTETVDIFKTQFSDLHALDAIQDSVSGPYNWKKDILQCMSWPNALGRIWRKLQIRGVLGATPFPLSDQEANTISRSDFVRLASKVREQSSSSDKRTLKNEAFAEAFSTLSDGILDNVYSVYREEFYMFGYDRLDLTSIRKEASQNKFKDFLNYANDITIK